MSASGAAEPAIAEVTLPAGVSSLDDLIGRPKDDVVELLKAANPDFEVPACHFAKGYKVKHDPKLIRVIYNTDGTVREFKRH